MRKGALWAVILLATGAARGQAEDQQDPQQQGAADDTAQPPADAGSPRATADDTAQPPADAGSPRATAGGTGSAATVAAPGTAAPGSSDAFDRACVDLLHGKTPQGDKAIRALREACANLMAGRVDEKLEAEQRTQAQLSAREHLRLQAEGRVQPGQSTASPDPGQGVLAAFGSAASELASPSRTRTMGMRARGPVSYTLVTNPVGWFSGLGVNAELFGAFPAAPKFSWVAGARYSEADATNGTASTFGGMAGADLFIIGRNNEGLRIGPRLELAAGRERFQGSTTFARLGMSGELGYNFIATNGITGLLAAGVGGRVAGNDKNDNFASFVGGEFGPYLKFGLGYSW